MIWTLFFWKGLNILLPIVDSIRYVQSLKEIAIEIPSQTAISKGWQAKVELLEFLKFEYFR